MNRTPTRCGRWLLSLVVAGMLMASCGDGAVTVLLKADGLTEAELGDELVIEVAENSSVGDDWEVAEPPDASVVRIVDDAYEADDADPEATGVGGTRAFTFEAVGKGDTTVVVHNCYRCDAAGNTPPEDAQEAKDISYHIPIR